MTAYTIDYTYDAVGNRTSMDRDGDVTTYNYAADNRLVSSTDSTAEVTNYSYDADGNLTRKEGHTELTEYEYDAAGRMTAADPFSGTVYFSYNGKGQRVRKETPAETRNYVYDGHRLLQTTDENDDPVAQYTHAHEDYGQLISEYDETGASTTYYQYDAQWSTDTLIDDDETETDRYRRTAFGLEEEHTGTSETPFSFVSKQGYFFDDELEMYFLGMSGNETRQGGRFYDPKIGRFVTQDPIGLAGGDINFYRYVKNNPVNQIDPSGLAPPVFGTKITGYDWTTNYGRIYSCYTTGNVSAKKLNSGGPDHITNIVFNYENVVRGFTTSRQRGTVSLGYVPWDINPGSYSLTDAKSVAVTRVLGGTDGRAQSQVLQLFDLLKEAKGAGRYAYNVDLERNYSRVPFRLNPLYWFNGSNNENMARARAVDGWWGGQTGQGSFTWPDSQSAGNAAFAKSISESDLLCTTLDKVLDHDVCGTIKNAYEKCSDFADTLGDAADFFPTIYAKGPQFINTFMGGVKQGIEELQDPKTMLGVLQDATLTVAGLNDFTRSDFDPILEAGAKAFDSGASDGASPLDIVKAFIDPPVLKFFNATLDNILGWVLSGLENADIPQGVKVAAYGAIDAFTKLGASGDPIGDFLDYFAGSGEDSASSVASSIRSDAYDFFATKFKEQLGQIGTQIFQELIGKVTRYVGGLLSGGVMNVIKTGLQMIDTLSGICSDVSEFLLKIMEALKSALSDPAGAQRSIASAMITGIKAVAVAAIRGLQSLINFDLGSMVTGLRTSVGTAVENAVSSLATTLSGAISSKFGSGGESGRKADLLELKGRHIASDRTVYAFIGQDEKLYLRWNPECELDTVNANNESTSRIGQCTGTTCSLRGGSTSGSGAGAAMIDKYKNINDKVESILSSTTDGINEPGCKLCCANANGNCFVAGTLVHTSDGTAPIEEIELGQRVMTFNEEDHQSPGQSELNLDDLHKIDLVLRREESSDVQVSLLRESDWLADHNAEVGETISLDMPDMSAKGKAEVLNIEAFEVDDKEGEGQLVTGTFQHDSGEVYDLHIEGEDEPVGVTGSHPFWSVDRGDWVPVKDLKKGEKLKAASGNTFSLKTNSCNRYLSVFNIEVSADHVYRIGALGTLVHNASVSLSYRYDRQPIADAPCGSAKDKIQWTLNADYIPQGSIIQEVVRDYEITNNGERFVVSPTENYFELWDVISGGTMFGNGYDEFADHPKGGENTKGRWKITGVAKYFPCYDVTVEDGWSRGGYGAGWLYTRPHHSPPPVWNDVNGSVSRVLMASWNCASGETRRETDITGSGRV